MRLVIVRHAEVSWEDALDNDPPLSVAGLEQARRLGLRFKAQSIDRLYCSPKQRARQTARFVADAAGLEMEILPWLREVECPLMKEAEMAKVEARPLEQWWDGFPASGESFTVFQQRVRAGVDGLLAGLGVRMGKLSDGGRPGPEMRICIVCHAGVTAAMVGHLIGVPPVPWEWYRFGMGHTGVTHVRIRALSDSVISTLTLFNCRSHLD